MRYDDSVIEEVLSRNDIVDVIGERMHLTKKGANYMGLCPFHGEKTASMSVNQSRQIFKCFGCGVGGNVIKFVEKYDNISWVEALQQLAARGGVELPQNTYSPAEEKRRREREQLYEINKDAAAFYYRLLRSPAGANGLRYFRERGLSDEALNHYGLGYSDASGDSLYKYLRSKDYPDQLIVKSGLCAIDEKRGGHDKFWNRVMYPIMNPNNRVLGFGGRVMGQGEPKYLNSQESDIFEKGKTLYGLADAKKSRKPYFLICEGYMDVIALWCAGFENSVAALGTAFTGLHAREIAKYTKNVVLTFDSDKAGIAAALRAIPILKRAGITCKVLNMSPCKDPDEFMKKFGPEEYEKRILDAKPSFEFEVDRMEAKYNLADPDEKTKFQNELALRLAEFSDDMERANYTEYVKDRYRMDLEPLKRKVNANLETVRNREQQEEERAEVSFEQKLKRKADSALTKAQKSLLTWAAAEKDILLALKKYVDPSQFTGLFGKVAEKIYSSEKEKINPAVILEEFDEEEQSEVADIFAYDQLPATSEGGREKMFSDMVRHILDKELEDRENAAEESGDLNLLVEIEKKRNELKKANFKIK
ncbi:MAG: DNA primase [Lachnospiraceae bacterium]|nr:DNA primase [Lachnospiraceae bacterium]